MHGLIPRGRSEDQRLFHERFPAYATACEEEYSADFGRFRLPLISDAAAVRVDDTQGVEGLSQAGSIAVRRHREAYLRPDRRVLRRSRRQAPGHSHGVKPPGLRRVCGPAPPSAHVSARGRLRQPRPLLFHSDRGQRRLIPPKGKHLVRRYGVYSSRGRGTWKDRSALRTKAPENWYGRSRISVGEPASVEVDTTAGEAVEVGAAARKKAWARLLAKGYEADPFQGHHCLPCA